ncbi:MAG: DNA polymerase III subunit alpha [Armatimonadetes bacterium]|nr:DNA polymerase III subunit alpha [Armatimonadota bacterium]
MASTQFVHLHAHSEYSLLDGACRIRQMVRKAADLQMPAVALTDHGVMYGAIQFYEAAKAEGIKPIIGCEVYVARGSRLQRENRGGGKYYHLLLLAANETGYKNLLKLVTISHLEGYYYKPRVDRETLQAHSEGLICLSSCLAGEVAQQVMEGQDKEALRTIAEHQEIFGRDNYFLELQDHDIIEQRKVNEFLIRQSEKFGAPLVATNDVHYLNADDADPHDVLLCIQTGATRSNPSRMKFSSQEFFFKDVAEMAARFKDYPGALERTVEIAERCNLELEFGRQHLPDLPIPHNRTPEEHLRISALEGLERRYPNAGAEIRERLEYELDVIIKCGFAKYLLIVQDFASFARSNSIMAGVRGSAAGSLVCYCLGITSVDPIFHKLTFERFLNPERIQMPDVDFDFQDDRRSEVIEYVQNQYGRDHVAQIITFGTLGAKAAIRDAARATEVSLSEADRLAKMIPSLPVGITIDQAMEDNPDLRQEYSKQPASKTLIDMARKLEGIARHSSTHAAGVLITRDPLVENVPLQRSPDGGYITQYDMNDVGKIGLLKMDFLGLINLSIIQKCLNLIAETQGMRIELQDIPADDAKAYEMLARAETTGLFQLESEGMRRSVRELKPQSIAELSALVALYRPGPMAHIPRYISNKFGRTKVDYMHESLKDILEETYGIIVYQDQVMMIVRAIAGFSLGHADILRRAMGKKDPVKMAQERQNFVDGAVDNGIKQEIATRIFDLIEPFAGYAFNKAHAVCYGTVAYQTAYLKANYTVEYLTALLACHAENQDKVAMYVEEARRLGLEILPPDVNHSEAGFSIGEQQRSIRFGLAAIKNCGKGLVEAIVEERKTGGAFKSLSDFAVRAGQIQGFNRSAFECLAKVGALDSLHPCRREIVECCEDVLAKVSRSNRTANAGQGGLFEDSEEDLLSSFTIALPSCGEYERSELLAMERDLLGLYVSDHPLNAVAPLLQKRCSQTAASMAQLEDGEMCTIGGVITNVRQYLTRAKQEKMASFTLEDLTGVARAIAFPRLYATSEYLIQRDNIVVISGKVQHTDSRAGSEEKGPAELMCESIEPLQKESAEEDALGQSPAQLLESSGALTIRLSARCRQRLPLLKDLLEQHRGDSPVFFKIGTNGSERTVLSDMRVRVTGDLAREVQSLLGVEALALL